MTKKPKWTVYGRMCDERTNRGCSITREFPSEATAILHIINQATIANGMRMHAVLVKQTFGAEMRNGRTVRTSTREVVLRMGNGKAWFE